MANEGNSGDDGAGGKRGTAAIEKEAHPVHKKLRSCEPYLKVTIGSDNETRWYHSAIIANYSKYVDAMLAAPMKESQTRHISFPDIEPNVWDFMLKFLQDPLEARKMTVNDAMTVARHYDKYSFVEGRRLCAQLLAEFFLTSEKNESQTPPEVDILVEAILLALDTNLDGAKEAGLNYFGKKLTSTDAPYGRTMFTEAHVKKLLPVFIEFKKSGSHAFRCWTIDEINSPDFPRLFVLSQRDWKTQRILYDVLHHITLSGASCGADGDYDFEYWGQFGHRGGTSSWGGVPVKFMIDRLKDNWVIYGETLPEVDEDGDEDYDNVVQTIYWESPCSENLPLPPETNWRPVDKLARGNPTIEYTFR